jgi:alkylated DNA repair dioxygenase AlkB
VIGERHELGYGAYQGAYVVHTRGFLSPVEAEQAFRQLRTELAWEARDIVIYGRRIQQPRLVAWGGDLPYRYSGQTLPPRAMTPTVAALVARVVAALGLRFNHVLANLYRNGDDSMGMHADAEPELGPDPIVVTLSFGATRRLRVVPRKGKNKGGHGDGVGTPRDFALASGDLFVMGGTCQRHFLHGIPKVRSVATIGERISLTLRDVKRAPTS